MVSCCYGASMKRTQIQLDDETYQRVRRRAFEEGRSISSVIRDILRASLGTGSEARVRKAGQFAFVGIGRSDQGDLRPVSERHDEALLRALENEA